MTLKMRRVCMTNPFVRCAAAIGYEEGRTDRERVCAVDACSTGLNPIAKGESSGGG